MCAFWFPWKHRPGRAPAFDRDDFLSGNCQRFPTHVETPPSYWCGEYRMGEVKVEGE